MIGHTHPNHTVRACVPAWFMCVRTALWGIILAWFSTKTLGGVHQAALWCKPRELEPLKPVADELVGEVGTLCSSPSGTPWSSLCTLIAITYSYVVIPCLQKNIKHIFTSKPILHTTNQAESRHTFLMRIRWKKKSSAKGIDANNETSVHNACKNIDFQLTMASWKQKVFLNVMSQKMSSVSLESPQQQQKVSSRSHSQAFQVSASQHCS